MEKDSMFFRKDRVASGIRELDILLEGGYPNPGTVLVLGPSGQEKLALAFHFAAGGLKAGEKVAYVALDLAPAEVEHKAAAFGIDLASHVGKNLTFIDAYSQKVGMADGERNDMRVPGPAALNDLSLAINDIIGQGEGAKIRVVFHSLSTLSIYSPSDSVIKFLQVIEGRLKNASATSLWLVDEGMHDKKFITTAEGLCDQKLSIAERAGAHEISIPDLPMPIPVRVGAAGLEIL